MFGTAYLNSLYNLMSWAIIWLRSGAADESDPFYGFWRDLMVEVQGDDNVAAVSKKVQDIFSPSYVVDAFSKIGLTYTGEDKKDPILVFRPLSEVSFLKRSFRYENALQRYVGPISLDTTLQLAYWTRKGPLCQEVLKTNLDRTFIELSLHAPEVWNQYAPMIVSKSA